MPVPMFNILNDRGYSTAALIKPNQIGERVEKYSQLMRIGEELGVHAAYAGRTAFAH